MIRKIIEIDGDKCNGCGLCANACHEGAIVMEGGRAHLRDEASCDGFGGCLPVCPKDAIKFVEREAATFDKAAAFVRTGRLLQHLGDAYGKIPRSEPAAAAAMALDPAAANVCATGPHVKASTDPALWEIATAADGGSDTLPPWPVQLRLVPVQAAYLTGADLLITADCAAYVHADFHRQFMRGRVTLIGCPKLDPVDYSEKLTAILTGNDVRALTVVRMQVPCCGGLERAGIAALGQAGRELPCQIVTLSTRGEVRL